MSEDEASGPVARHVCVQGRVQGVFFRDTCTDEAYARGVDGWVRNDPGGTVSAHFEGAESDVIAMVEWCRSGPPRARVDAVDVREAAPEGFDGFSVR